MALKDLDLDKLSKRQEVINFIELVFKSAEDYIYEYVNYRLIAEEVYEKIASKRQTEKLFEK
jgi:hypothetical protein